MANRPSRHRRRLRSRARLWGQTLPLGDLTRSPHNLSWTSMDEEHAAARTDTPEELASGPTLTPVRRRGESHLLALMLAAAVVFVAAAIAKPWGDGAPPPGASAATTSLVAEIATPSTESAPPPEASAALEFTPTETDQLGFIVVQRGDSSVTYTMGCAQDPGMSPSLPGSAESVMSSRIVALMCTGANLERLGPVLPSPSAP